MGKTVHDTKNSDVGTVTDILLDGDGQITDVIIDFDCFLGVGSNPASLEYEELTFWSYCQIWCPSDHHAAVSCWFIGLMPLTKSTPWMTSAR
ncbi:PRC-barrel domain-containing protein [Marivita lacus]|uniref:PRC-barrel domain-containing protein n=1 Tax=Marivita lacus TaxID=1323742 RepID=UPI00357149D3